MFGFSLKKEILDPNVFASVASGKIIPLANVKDEVFSAGMMGMGAAIVPDDDVIVAPCDGEITMLFPTMHAFGIMNKDGIEVLVHIGIDTVNRHGKGFKKFVDTGANVKCGDRIIKMDSYELKQEGYDLTTMMIFPDCQKEMKFTTEGYATKGKTVVAKY